MFVPVGKRRVHGNEVIPLPGVECQEIILDDRETLPLQDVGEGRVFLNAVDVRIPVAGFLVLLTDVGRHVPFPGRGFQDGFHLPPVHALKDFVQ